MLCFFASYIGIVLGNTSAMADVLWPANGILLAILLLSPRQTWPVYLCLGFITNVLAHAVDITKFPIYHTVLFSVANIVEILVAATALAERKPNRPDFTQWKVLGKFLLFGLILAPLGSVAVVQIGRLLEHSSAQLIDLWNWYSGDVLGIAIVTPMILAVHFNELKKLFSREKCVETLALLLGLLLFSIGIFYQSTYPVAFLLFPLLLFVTVRLQSSGAAIGIFLIAIPAIYFTSRGRGPFSLLQGGFLLHKITLVQCFLGMLLITVYAVSAMLAQRDRLEQQLQDAYREASGRAATDHVTGLANRRTFEHELSREWYRAIREQGSLSLLMIDIDYFKNYNDFYGHVAGDLCLYKVASLLSSGMVRSSDLLARYGGEEFAVILPGSRAEGAAIIAQRLRDIVLQARIPHAASQVGIVTLSIGVASLLPAQDLNAKDLVEAADQALYRAKLNGRDQVSI